MPLPDLPVPQFPNVPDVPGVPALVRIAGAPVIASVNAALIKVGLGQFAFGLNQPVWGIFDASNQAIAVSDSVGSFEFRSDSHASQAPMEQGAFQAYNKVQLPFEARMILHCGGTIEKRQAFLQAIELAKQSTNLYSIVTPEASYFNVNVASYGYRRTVRDGATLLSVEVGLNKIRQATAAQFNNTPGAASADPTASVTGQVRVNNFTNPASASPVSQGQVQAIDANGVNQTALQNIAASHGLTTSTSAVNL